MKFAIATLVGLLLSGAAFSQQSTSGAGSVSAAQDNPPANQAATPSMSQTVDSPRFAPGTVIPVELTKSIDAKKAKTGDGVEARVTQDLRAGNGQVIVPKDTKVVGHLTEAQSRNKEQKESQVGIIFDRAVMKNGTDVAMPMSIQAIIGPAAVNPASNSAGGAATAGQSPQPSPASGMPSGNAGGRATGMGSSGSSSSVSPSTAGGEAPAEAQPGTESHQPITASTQGVVGISNLKLSPAGDSKTGSVVSSEKSNVKLDSGTFMLLRVNQ